GGPRERCPGRARRGGATRINDLHGSSGEDLHLRLQPSHRPPNTVQVERLRHECPASVQRDRFIQREGQPAAEPVEEVLGRKPRIHVGGQVVEGQEDGCKRFVEGGHEPLGKRVLLKKGGQKRYQRV